MSVIKLDSIKEYNDKNNNSISCSRQYDGCTVFFKGSNNKIKIADGALLSNVIIHMDCDNGELSIGKHDSVNIPFKGIVRIGQDSKVLIGNNVTCSPIYISAVEGAKITIGEDCMFATSIILRSDDSHPIFDVRTGKRVNPAKDINIGNHVWVGERAMILGGTTIGDGSIVGMGSIVKKKFPNNCILAGIPARITRKHIAWERPHLSLSEPYMKPDSSCVKKSNYWNYTDDV
ncbi:TPA: acyltransferase [Escherichia coli]|nr:acyltransferase [Escherichia coli]HAW3063590.1 acyltransferase [Escherichia coli]